MALSVSLSGGKAQEYFLRASSPAVTLKMGTRKAPTTAERPARPKAGPSGRGARPNARKNRRTKHTFRAVGQEWLTTKFEKEHKAKATIKAREMESGPAQFAKSATALLCEIEPPETAHRPAGARRPAADTIQSGRLALDRLPRLPVRHRCRILQRATRLAT